MSDATKIEWCDATWSPMTGCSGPTGTVADPQPCPFCYARRLSKRLKAMGQEKYRNGFAPTFHPEELERPAGWKKPKRIFVNSMSDIMDPGFSNDEIKQVIQVAVDLPRHTFLFLTKRPERLADFNPWPRNAWAGVTVTDQSTMVTAHRRLRWVDAPVRFVSVEPMLGPVRLVVVSMTEPLPIQWIIIGRQTGPTARHTAFDPQWMLDLAEQAKGLGVPVFLKANLGALATMQEFPSKDG